MLIIGISGGSCSGKSTLADNLNEQLSNDGFNVLHINMDCYYKTSLPNVTAPITRIEYQEYNHPEALDLEKMYSDFNAVKEKAEYDLFIIDGVFALCLDPVREMLDYKFFVDLPSDERLVRRLKRASDPNEQGFADIATRYLDTVRYRHDEFVEPSRWHADIVINGALDTHKGQDLLLFLLRQLLAK